MTIQSISFERMDGSTETLADSQGSVRLIVNVASKCGLTPQYEGLEALYRAKKDAGLTVLGFPANNFMGQEPGTNDEIASFCKTNYDVTFPVFSKISVVGDDQHPLYGALTSSQPEAIGEGPMRKNLASYDIDPNPAPAVLWNFEKFLVSRAGDVVARFSPDVAADDPRLVEALEAELAK